MKSFISLSVAILLLSACATNSPVSIVDPSWNNKADRYNYQVLITEIDGVRLIDRNRIRQLEPGTHQLKLTSTKFDFHGGSVTTDFTLEARACVRYYLTAQHKDLYDNEDWQIKVREEPIGYCHR